MGGTVDGVAGQVARDGAHVGVTGVVGGVIALLHDISAAHDPIGQVALRALLTVGTVQLLAMQVNVGLHLQQALFVLLVGANTIGRHVTFLHFTIFFRLLEVYVKTRNRFYTHNQGSKHRKWYSVFDGGSHLN